VVQENPIYKSTVLFYKKVGYFTWRESDCEELVGSNTNLLHPFISLAEVRRDTASYRTLG